MRKKRKTVRCVQLGLAHIVAGVLGEYAGDIRRVEGDIPSPPAKAAMPLGYALPGCVIGYRLAAWNPMAAIVDHIGHTCSLSICGYC